MTTDERIRRLIHEHLGVAEDKIVPTAHIVDDLGADSLDAIEMVMALEEEFTIEINDGEMEGITTVDSINTLVAGKRKVKA